MTDQIRKVIFWLDDQPHFLLEYQEELDRDDRMGLIFVSDVDTALIKLKEENFDPDLLIWDMMLPDGSLSAEQTESGLRTGEVFYKKFRERFPQTPAMLFTNVSTPGRLAPYDKHGEDGSWAYQKRDLMANEFVTMIAKILDLEPYSQGQSHAP